MRNHFLSCLCLATLFLTNTALAQPDRSGQQQDSTNVHIEAEGSTHRAASDTWIICHGYGGTLEGDRFHQLASTLKDRQPQANVLRVDWSAVSRSTVFGMPDYWTVADQIDPVAEQAAELLKQSQLVSGRVHLAGESFGAYLAARIAQELGSAETIIALNPASELGGYSPVPLSEVAEVSIAVHTNSVFDSLEPIADADYLLQSEQNVSEAQKHTSGVIWLTQVVQDGQFEQVLDQSAEKAYSSTYSGLITPSGELIAEPVTPQMAFENPGHEAVREPDTEENAAVRTLSLTSL